jgi:hypothetical protein
MRFLRISIARIRLKFKKTSLGFQYIIQLGLAKNIEGCFKILLSYLACSQMWLSSVCLQHKLLTKKALIACVPPSLFLGWLYIAKNLYIKN